MGNTDSVPVVSQVKSFVQCVAGDSDGALKTQQNFIRGCPVVSQVTSTVQLIQGDTQAAKQTQMYFVKNLSNLADGIPVVGHVKGVVHYACGDMSGGNGAMIAASRSTGVIIGGIGGGLLGGPAGAVVGGMAAGATMDGITTGVDTAIKGEFSPHGHVALGYMAAKGKLDAGTAFDWAMMPVFDGLAGRAYSKVYRSIRSRITTNKNLKLAVKQAIEAGEITLQEGETVSSLVEQLKAAAFELQETMKNSKPGALGEKSVASVVIDVEGNQYVGYSYKLRKAVNINDFQGDLPTASKIMENRLSRNYPTVRGFLDGEPQCAESHGFHQLYQANGLEASPAKTITVMHDGTGVKAFARCGTCKRVANFVNMGEVPTDALNGTRITLDGSSALNTAMDLLQTLECDCEDGDHDLDAAELSLSKSGHHVHQD